MDFTPRLPAHVLALALLAVTFVQAGCQFGPGACSHEFRDPVLALEVSGPPHPATVALTAITINGRAPGPLQRLADAPAFRVRVGADTLYCDAPCGFSTDEGMYSFQASAVGYRARTVVVQALYRDFDGGCPSENSGSTEVRVVLTPDS